MAGVQKVVQTTPEGLTALEGSIRGLARELPFAADEIARVVQTAAQLGVPIPALENFTEVVLKLGASTNLSADEAAEGLARFAAVLQIPLTAIEPLASALVNLGNTSGVTESEILALGTSLASSAKNIGLTGDQVLAIAAGLRRVGADFEAGSSAVRTAFSAIQRAARQGGDDLDLLAEKTGTTREEFARLAAEEPAEAFVQFLGTLNVSAGQTEDILGRLGLAQIRFSRELGKAANGIDFIRQALDNSEEAYQRNTALTEEFGIFAGISANQIQVLKNQIDDVQISLGRGLIPVLQVATGAFAALSPATVGLAGGLAGVVALGFVVGRAANIIKSLEGGLRSIPGFAANATAANAALAIAQQRAAITAAELAAANKAATLSVGELAAVELRASIAAEQFAAAQATAAAATTGLSRAGTLASKSLKLLGAAAGTLIIFDLLDAVIERAGEAISSVFTDAPPTINVASSALLDFAEGVITAGQAIDELGIDLQAPIFNTFLGDPNIAERGLRILNDIGAFLPGVKNSIEEGQIALEGLDKALASIASQDPELAARIFARLNEEILNLAPDEVTSLLDEFSGAVDGATDNQRVQNIVTAESEQRALELGDAVRLASGELFTFGDASAVASSALSSFNRFNQEFEQRVGSLIPAFGQLVIEQNKGAKAADKLARAQDDAAEKIADAERALAEAREDAAERIADAERRLAEAQEDAIERVIDAQRRLQDARLGGRRAFRDAQQELQDFQAALRRSGGAQTPEDLIRLRELNEAVRDARVDAERIEQEGARNIADAREEGAEQIAEARRNIAEVEEENAERIADALRRLAEAHEDAAQRIADAQAKTGSALEDVIDTADELTRSFLRNATDLNSFSGLMEDLAEDVFRVFDRDDVGEAFLAGIAELGPESIPLLRSLSKLSDKELRGVVKAFDKQIKAAKRAADLQFDKFPDNFREKIDNATVATADELDGLIDQFDRIDDKTSHVAAEVEKDILAAAGEIEKLADAGLVHLTSIEQGFLETGLAAETSKERIRNLKRLIESIKNRTVEVDLNDKPVRTALEKLFEFMKKGLGSSNAIFRFEIEANKLHSGGRAEPGIGQIIGQAGHEEMFVADRPGTILSHPDTRRVLEALQSLRTSGNVVNNVQVNEVAQSPRATARAVTFLLGQQATR